MTDVRQPTLQPRNPHSVTNKTFSRTQDEALSVIFPGLNSHSSGSLALISNAVFMLQILDRNSSLHNSGAQGRKEFWDKINVCG